MTKAESGKGSMKLKTMEKEGILWGRFQPMLQQSLLREERVSGLPRDAHACVISLAALAYEQVYLENLPNAQMYERSYMHRDVITHTICTR